MKTLTSLLLAFAFAAIGFAQEPGLTIADLSYGPHAANVLDFWRAEGEGPRPLVVYIHGGGWTASESGFV